MAARDGVLSSFVIKSTTQEPRTGHATGHGHENCRLGASSRTQRTRSQAVARIADRTASIRLGRP